MKKLGLKEILIRILCIIMVVCIPQQTFAYTMLDVVSEGKQYEMKMKYYRENEQLKFFLNKEKESNKGYFKGNKERILNEAGIFDDELELLSAEEIDVVNNAKCIKVSTQYVEYTDCSEGDIKDGESVTERILNEEEVDELIEDLMYEKYSLEEGKENFIDGLMQSIGLKPITTYAATRSKTSNNKTSYLKKSLIVTQTNSIVCVIFTCNWLKEPSNRMMDYVQINYNGATKNSNYKYSSVLTYEKEVIPLYVGNDGTKTTSEKDDFTKNVTWRAGEIYAPFALPEDVYTNNIIIAYNNIKYKFTCWLDIIGKSGTKPEGAIEVDADYYHQIKNVKIDKWGMAALLGEAVLFVVNPGETVLIRIISAGSGAATAIGSVDVEKYYDTAGGDICYVNFSYK